MSHFTVLVPAKDEDDLREKLMPFHEFGWGDGEADDEVLANGYVVFKDVLEDGKIQEEYETGTIERVVMPDGRLLAPWDDEFRVKHAPGVWGGDTHEAPAHLERRQVPFKELYPTFTEFVEEYHGYRKDEKLGKYGYYTNPNAKWDWYSVGGRWTGILKLKRNGTSLPEFDRDVASDETIQKMVFIRRQMPDQYASMIADLKTKNPPEAVDAVDRYIEAIMATYKMEGSGLGTPGVMTEPSFDIGTADYAPAGNVDWGAMKSESINNARKRWQTAERIFTEAGQDVHKWAYHKINEEWEEARDIFAKVQEHFSSSKDRNVHDDVIDVMFFEPLGTSEEEHVNAYRVRALTHAAIDLEGHWLEQGEMGWWGFVHTTEPDYDRAFWELIETIPPETTVYCVDCHI